MSFTYEKLEVKEDDFVKEGTANLSNLIKAALQSRGTAVVGLSGGSTPGPIYEALGKDTSIDWSKVHIFLVDERYIDESDKNSNANLVRNTLGKNATSFNSVFPNPSLPLSDYVQDYAKRLNDLFSTHGIPDVLTLGMGPDGHIASLFPPVPSHAFDETLTAIHSTTDKFAVRDRISITMPVIKKAKKHVFLMKGKDKLDLWNEMASANADHTRWPAHDVLAEKRTTLIVGV